MPECIKCKVEFKRRVEIDGRAILLSNSRASCLDCIPYKQKGQPRKGRRKVSNRLERRCRDCKKWLADNQFRYEIGRQCISCRNKKAKPRTLNYKLELKRQAVEYMGSQCQDCEGKFPLCAYDFHHLDPAQKDFCISKKTNFKEVKVELNKCVMLCKNCHSIRHVRNKGFMQIL